MSGVSDSMGPVNPRITPILISAVAKAGRIMAPAKTSARCFNIFLQFMSLLKSDIRLNLRILKENCFLKRQD